MQRFPSLSEQLERFKAKDFDPALLAKKMQQDGMIEAGVVEMASNMELPEADRRANLLLTFVTNKKDHDASRILVDYLERNYVGKGEDHDGKYIRSVSVGRAFYAFIVTF